MRPNSSASVREELEANHLDTKRDPREIALAFGVPPMLLGIPGDNTYSNYAEANRAFYRQTVLPLLSRVLAGVSNWLAPAYGGEISLEADLDQVPALAAERDQLWKRIGEFSER